MTTREDLIVRFAGGSRVLQPGESVVIGRGDTADLSITTDNRWVSKRHARLEYRSGGWVIEDIGSNRGIWLQGQQRDSIEIVGPIELWVGPQNEGVKVELVPEVRRVQAPAQTPAPSEEVVTPRVPVVPRQPPRTPTPQTPTAPGIRVQLGSQPAREFPRSKEVIVGRDPGADVVSTDNHVSRQHARIRWDGSAWVLDDTSRRGIFDGGKQVTGPLRIEKERKLRLADPRQGDVLILTPLAVAGPTSVPIASRSLRSIVLSAQRNARIAAAVAAAAVLAAVALAVGIFGGFFSGGGKPDTSRLERSTVLITGLDKDGQTSYIGSGTVITKHGLILTNAHVGKPDAPGLALSEGAEEKPPKALLVSIFVGEDKPAKAMYRARVVVADGYLDAAVLQIDATKDGTPLDPSSVDLPAIKLGDSDSLAENDPVYVVGYPGVGNGFGGTNNSTAGTVLGFTPDPRISDRRAWIKTESFVIAHGNSGGLAADRHGHLIGVPTRYFATPECNAPNPGPLSCELQGRIRPIKLLLPLIKVAKEGLSYSSPYFVHSTGQESFTFQGFASQEPDQSCSYQTVDSYASGTKELIPVFKVAGLAPKEDLGTDWFYLQPGDSDVNDAQAISSDLGTWGSGSSAPCYWKALSSDKSLDDGTYIVAVKVGPSQRIIDIEKIVVGSAGGSSTNTTPTNTTPTDPTPTNPTPTNPAPAPSDYQACSGWTPSQFQGTGAPLPAGTDSSSGAVVADKGVAALESQAGDPRGYDTLAEAKAAAIDAASKFLQDAQPFTGPVAAALVQAVVRGRWLVITADNRYYAYSGSLWYQTILHVDPGNPDPDNFVAPRYSEEPNPEPKPGCTIDPATIAEWTAYHFGSDNSPLRYDFGP